MGILTVTVISKVPMASHRDSHCHAHAHASFNRVLIAYADDSVQSLSQTLAHSHLHSYLRPSL
jgi:hypothetical protein